MSESEIMRNQPLSCTALQQSNHPRVNSNIALNSKTRVDARQRKRREDARALPKLSRNERGASMNFARSAFGVRCVLASLSLSLASYREYCHSPIDPAHFLRRQLLEAERIARTIAHCRRDQQRSAYRLCQAFYSR